MWGWVIAAFTITIAASLAKSGKPGAIWLAITLALNIGAALYRPQAGDQSMYFALANFGVHCAIYMVARFFREGIGAASAWAAFEVNALATFVMLTFFDGFEYNAWNWLIAIPINIFLAEIWPIYWVILKPLFG